MIGTAEISPCGEYRYSLTRTWGDPSSRNILCVWMLNPSDADAAIDDPTVRRVIGFAKREGCDGIEVFNAYALRSSDPRALLSHPNPTGPLNNEYLIRAIRRYPNITVAWGANISVVRETYLAEMLEDAAYVSCFGVTKDGHPRHPLYLRADTPLVGWL